MKKVWIHPDVFFDVGAYCRACGGLLDEHGLAPYPCVEPTLTYVTFDVPDVLWTNNVLWAINVWNMRAEIMAVRFKRGKTVAVDVKIDEDIKKDLDAMIEADVERQGALNISGVYSIGEETARAIEGWLKDKKITVN